MFTKLFGAVKKQLEANNLYDTAKMHLINKNYSEALIAADKCIEIEPMETRSHYIKSMVYDELRQFDSAINEMKVVIQKNPQDFSAYTNIVALNFFMKDNINLGTACTEALKIKDDPSVNYFYAYHLLLLNDPSRYEKDIRAYREKAKKKDVYISDLFKNAAEINLKRGKIDRFELYFDVIIELAAFVGDQVELNWANVNRSDMLDKIKELYNKD